MEKNFCMSGGVFAASNSSLGFKSYYGEIFAREKFEKVYIIKGGPGTGKSKFMRDIAEFAEARGRSVERYYCSSDPDSLDGLIVEGRDGRIAFLDGTAPHEADVSLPGARDEIINLGVFWDSAALSAHRREISELAAAKSDAYAKGYKFLSAAGNVADISESLIFSAIKQEKLLGAAERFVKGICGDCKVGSIVPALVDSVGMRGRVRFGTYEGSAERTYLVVDRHSSAHIFISAVIVEAQRRGLSMRVSYDPVLPSRPDALYFEGASVALVAVSASDADDLTGSRINMGRFIDRDALGRIKSELKYDRALYDALLSSACDAFESAGVHHFALEQIYSSCMDFTAKESYTRSFCEMLF